LALRVRDLSAGYGRLTVLRGVSLDVAAGEVVALLGANGAGKTTLLRSLSGLLRPAGRVELFGAVTSPRSPEQMARLGVGHVPQGRGTFPNLTVRENLLAGAAVRRAERERVEADIEAWLEMFPPLRARLGLPAGGLSGGEQQMLAVSRAMMGRPRLLLLDEPSLGLAPRVVHELYERLAALNEQWGTAMLVVEQNATVALATARRAYVLESGRIAVSGDCADLRSDPRVKQAYLGV